MIFVPKMRYFRFDLYSIVVLGLNLGRSFWDWYTLFFRCISVFWDFCGWLFLASWISTIILFLFVTWTAGPDNIVEKRVDLFGYVTLAVLGLCTFFMFGVSFL